MGGKARSRLGGNKMALPALIILGGIALYAYASRGDKKSSRSVFVSYYAKETGHLKNLIKAWTRNQRFSLDFEDMSTDTSINSIDESYIKRRILERLKSSNAFLVIIGENTHSRNWVDWEITKAKDLGIPLVAVKEKRSYKSPPSLLNSGARWVYGLNHDKIAEAIEEVS